MTRSVALSDTVGFIRDLPHALIEAFQATLQEAADADPAAARRRRASPELFGQMAEVQRVLAEIDAGGVPQVVVFNKLDRMDETERPRELVDAIELPSGERVTRVFVSALTGEGLDLLRARIAEAALGNVDDALKADVEASSETMAEGPVGSEDPEGDETVRTGTYHSHA